MFPGWRWREFVFTCVNGAMILLVLRELLLRISL